MSTTFCFPWSALTSGKKDNKKQTFGLKKAFSNSTVRSDSNNFPKTIE